ncbi:MULTISPECIES: hypothetical protein [Pontibacter]|uniref:Outer membrane protein beta-barrel domain-containing protein n=1 Tax=Pontibacter lucknowensis TaxID=1077936 RepID=A0A1N6Y549_9BACT|nr:MULTISPECIES: hypothetical protein [Pontibacter]EJF09531.1 hypothetical protein O71_14506 [Pontibacter sp. BAB1700]SIR09775.1 hypothetical protein SAMN05421545_2273 [Pontibacter lucknowensis]
MHLTSAFTRGFLFCFLLLISLTASAQNFRDTFRARNAVYAELGGNGDLLSANFDRIVYQKSMLKAAFRIGIASNTFFSAEEPGFYPVVPVEALGMIGRFQKHFEFGLGYTRRFTNEPDLLRNMYFSRIGFRYQNPTGGLVVRVGFTPFLSTESNTKSPGPAFIPRFGFSVGRSF